MNMARKTETPTPPTPLDALLVAAEAAAELALELYADTERLAPLDHAPSSRELFQRGEAIYRRLQQRQQDIRGRLIEAGEAVIAHDYGARAPQADVKRRVRDVWQACQDLIDWGLRHRGRQPPEWSASGDEAAPPWANDVTVLRAEQEREVLFRKLASTSGRLELLRQLCPVEPRRGALPPDRFRWDGVQVSGLPTLQFKLLAALCDGEELRTSVPVAEVLAAVYGIDPNNRPAITQKRRALKELKARTQKSLNDAGIRLWIEQAAGKLQLKPVAAAR
jgi:hypothetical protein